MRRYFEVALLSGVITHDDQEKSGLSFSCAGGVVAVDGTLNTIRTWAVRNGAIAVTEADALARIKTATIAGIRSRIDEIKAEEMLLLDKLSKL